MNEISNISIAISDIVIIYICDSNLINLDKKYKIKYL